MSVCPHILLSSFSSPPPLPPPPFPPLLLLSGFLNTSIAVILHQLGPDCATSNVQAIKAIVQRCRFGYSEDHPGNTSFIRSNPVTDAELRSLIEVSLSPALTLNMYVLTIALVTSVPYTI